MWTDPIARQHSKIWISTSAAGGLTDNQQPISTNGTDKPILSPRLHRLLAFETRPRKQKIQHRPDRTAQGRYQNHETTWQGKRGSHLFQNIRSLFANARSSSISRYFRTKSTFDHLAIQLLPVFRVLLPKPPENILAIAILYPFFYHYV